MLQDDTQIPDTFGMSRHGLFTASEIAKLLKGGSRPMTEDELRTEKDKKGKRKKIDTLFGDTAMSYIYDKIAEFVTGESKHAFKSEATDWGLNEETDAIKYFELITGKKVRHFGMAEYKFYPYKTIGGCSPDGMLVDENSCIQVKCPFLSSNHIVYLLAKGDNQQWLKKNKPDYYAQCQFEMMCTEVDKCYFVSYDRRAIEHYHRMAVIELLPDIELQNELAERVLQAAVILHEAIEELQTPDPIYKMNKAA